MPMPSGPRPVLLLSRNEAYAVRSLVTVAPITSRIRGIPAEVPLGTEDGLPKASVVNLDALATVSRDYLRARVAVLSQRKMKKVEAAIRFALGME